MVRVSLTLLTLLLTSLMVTSCKTATMPQVPRVVVYQPIIEQNICDDSGCAVRSMCLEYTIGNDGKFGQPIEHELKKCHATLGVTAKDYTVLRQYYIKLNQWAIRSCKNVRAK